jgi:hypothetical protein
MTDMVGVLDESIGWIVDTRLSCQYAQMKG